MRTRRSGALVLLVLMTAACASREDVTPMIVVSPGARERIMVMDRLRHHGAPRRFLPKVTVEEVDEDELPAAEIGSDDGGPRELEEPSALADAPPPNAPPPDAPPPDAPPPGASPPEDAGTP